MCCFLFFTFKALFIRRPASVADIPDLQLIRGKAFLDNFTELLFKIRNGEVLYLFAHSTEKVTVRYKGVIVSVGGIFRRNAPYKPLGFKVFKAVIDGRP